MNNERRKQIEAAAALIAEALEILSVARDEEQDYFDNMPESIQGGEKGERASAAVDALDSAIGDLENVDFSEAVA